MAIAEIFRDTAKASVRAEKEGASGWLPCPLLKTNKRFLSNTLKSVITHNKRHTQATGSFQHKQRSPAKRKSEAELDEMRLRLPKFGQRKHSFRKVEKKMS